MTAWQPIETAPKDTSRILLWASDCGDHGKYPEIRIGWFEGMGYGTMWVNDELWFGWVSVETRDDGYGSEENIYLSPTHWMPLPEPPK